MTNYHQYVSQGRF